MTGCVVEVEREKMVVVVVVMWWRGREWGSDAVMLVLVGCDRDVVVLA